MPLQNMLMWHRCILKYKAYVNIMINTQNYWVLGPTLSSGILKSREHKVSEIGYVSILTWGDTHTVLGPLERTNLKQWRTQTDPVSETLCYLGFRISDDGHYPKTH
jgi:hypothetical protein